MVHDAILLGLLAALVSGTALLAVTLVGSRVQRISRPLSIAAGGMLATLLALHILPEALSASSTAWAYCLAGGALGIGLQAGLRSLSEMRWPATALAGGPHGTLAARTGPGMMLALAPLSAIALHSLLDGMVYGLAFTGGQASGVYAASALIIHEVPEAFVAFALASAAGLALRQAALAALCAAALTTPLGAALSTLALEGAASVALSALFALSAGLLTYVALGPLLSPLYRRTGGSVGGGAMALAAGMLAGLALMSVHLPHGSVDAHGAPMHAHNHDHAPGDGHHHPNFSPFR